MNNLNYFTALFFLLEACNAYAGIIFSDDFSSGGRGAGNNSFSWVGGANNIYADTDPLTGLATIPYSGSYSLAFAHRAKADGSDSSAEQRFSIGSPLNELWMSYYVRIPDNYTHREQASSANNKWLAIWTNNYESNGIAVVLEYWPSADGGSKLAYRWVTDGKDTWHHGHTTIIDLPTDRGKWMHFVVHVKLSSGIGIDNGIIEAWIKYEESGGYTKLFDEKEAPLYANTATQGFSKGYLMGWSNSGFSEETIFYIDDFHVSTTPLIGTQPKIPSQMDVD